MDWELSKSAVDDTALLLKTNTASVTRSVKFGKRYGVPIHVRSSFSKEEGTWVVPEEDVMERLVVSGVTYNKDEAKITIFGVSDVPGAAARIFSPR